MSQHYFAVSARSVDGLVRNGNEDSAFSSPRVLAVADGMGGHVGGEVASSTAIKTLAGLAKIFTDENVDSESADDLFLNALHTINSEIRSATDENPKLSGMGTTLTSLFLTDDRVALLHIGDSRAYRLRGNTFDQLSTDHTVLQELLEKGAITEAEAHDHPQRSMLTQVLMGEEIFEPALTLYDVKASDRFLLCSDGLSSVLTEKEIKSLLKVKKREEALTSLIDATYLNGAPDNVTIIIADIATENSHEVSLWGAAR